MTEAKLYQQHRRLYSKFYELATRRHGHSGQLAGKLRALLERVDHPQDDRDKMYLMTVQPRRPRDESPLNEMQSLRITPSSSKNALDVSRSKSKRSDSSRQRDRSEGESRFFGTDWVYSSCDQSRVVVFVTLASFILTDNAVGFLKLQDRMNEELEHANDTIPPILRISISKYWQRVAEIVTKKKSYLWEKNLKEPIDRMPLEFNILVARVILGAELSGGAFTREEAGRLSKEGRVSIANFSINCREIESVEREGAFPSEIIIGYLRHRNTYVIANKIPEYSDNELKHRRARAFLQQGIAALLTDYHLHEQELGALDTSTLPNQKEKVVKEFLTKKLAALRPT